MAPPLLYWLRNIFGVMLLAALVFVIVPDEFVTPADDVRAAVGFALVAFLMAVCWGLTQTPVAAVMPTWFVNGWVPLVVGIVAAFMSLIFWLSYSDRPKT